MIVSTLLFPIAPPPSLDSTYNRLSAAVHVHAFHPDGLLGLADAFGPPCDRHQRHEVGRRASHERRDFCNEDQCVWNVRCIAAIHAPFAWGCRQVSSHPPPPGLDVADDGLPAVRDVNVLHRDCLLAAVAVFAQSLDLGGKGPCQPVISPFVRLELR